MRVVHAVGWYFPESLGGTEVYVSAVARELSRTGVDVRIAAPAPGTAGAATYDHEGVPVFRYPIPCRPTRGEARGESPVRGTELLHDWLKSEQPDIVHFHTFVTGLDLIEVEEARNAGARVFVTSHSSALGYICLRGSLLRFGKTSCDGLIRDHVCAACALQHRGLPRPLAWTAAAMPAALARVVDRFDHPVGTLLGLPAYIERRELRQRRLFRLIDGFFALTTAARDILIANGAPPEKVHVNRLGVDTDAIVPDLSARARRSKTPLTFGYLGRLDPIKGVEDLLRAVLSLDPALAFRLDVRGISGDAPTSRVRAACERAAALDSRITVGGPVLRENVAAVLTSWDVLCCPGRSLEGGPTVVLEAFAAGTPVIGTRLGGPAELVCDEVNGRLVAPGDWRGLATVIADLAQRPSVVDEWRAKLPAVRSMRDVTADYLTAYRS